MAENTEKLIKDADDAVDTLKSHSIGLPGGAEQVEDNFKKKLPLSVIKSGIAKFEKDLGEFDKDLQEAGKTEKTLETRIKLKNALEIFKTQKSLDAAKKSHAALDAQIKKSDADYKKLEGQLKIFKPLLVKVEKDRAEEAKVGDQIDKIVKAAEEATKDLNGQIIGLPGTADLLDDNFEKNIPAPAIKSTLKIFEKSLTEFGGMLTTAESISSSLEGFIKKEGTFDLPDTLKSVADAKKAQAALDDKHTKGKSLLAKLLQRMKGFKAQLKDLGG